MGFAENFFILIIVTYLNLIRCHELIFFLFSKNRTNLKIHRYNNLIVKNASDPNISERSVTSL